mgnify:CR=1 FL=1
MGKSLVIVESPAKAKTISKYLGNEYIVKSSVGHIRDLPKGKSKAKRQNSIPKDASPEEKARLKKEQERTRIIRRMGVNPDDGWTANYEIIPDKEKVIKDLRKASKEVEKVYLATDLDREGEAIAWHLKEALGKNKFEYHRVRFNEITKSSILESFADPKEIDQDLVNAQQARRFLDRVVGFELSPLLWKKIARGLSAGRVQSVALKLLCEREKLISQFQPEEFWEVSATLKDFNNEEILFKLNRKKSDPLLEEDEAKKIEELVNSSSLKISEITKKPTTVKPRAPFITSTLQQAASSKLGFGVSRTMGVAQKLYEAGRITYMRTDAPSLSNDSIEDARLFIKDTLADEYLTEKPRIYSGKENAQEAHEAIRPTSASLTPEKLTGHSEEEVKLYDLIWRQFISCQMPDAKYLSIKDSGCRPYYSPLLKKRGLIDDLKKTGDVIITEGEKKTDSLVFHGFTAIGIAGVDCWRDGRSTEMLPELEAINWNRNVFLAFDSDVVVKDQVKQALKKLSEVLTEKGANVRVVTLPCDLNGTKNGVDDFIVKYGKEALIELLKWARPSHEKK